MLQIMCLSLGQFANTMSSPPSNTVEVTICIIKVKVKITVILDNACSQVEIDSTFTAIARFVFNNEKLLTIEFIAYLLHICANVIII